MARIWNGLGCHRGLAGAGGRRWGGGAPGKAEWPLGGEVGAAGWPLALQTRIRPLSRWGAGLRVGRRLERRWRGLIAVLVMAPCPQHLYVESGKTPHAQSPFSGSHAPTSRNVSPIL